MHTKRVIGLQIFTVRGDSHIHGAENPESVSFASNPHLTSGFQLGTHTEGEIEP
jgi:hypothetical protein